MERLTKPDWNKSCYDACELCGMYKHCTRCEYEDGGCCRDCHILDMHRKLAEYENEEEQGLLIRLPCKIGDTVYRICPKCNDNHNGNCEGCFWRKNKFGHGCSIYGYEGVKGIKRQIVPYKVIWGYVPNLIEHIGKHVFLTYEDAERKLKEMEEN